MCHPNFEVTIEPNSWELIAVEGYEYDNFISVGGAYSHQVNTTAPDHRMCRSAQRKSFIKFNLQVEYFIIMALFSTIGYKLVIGYWS